VAQIFVGLQVRDPAETGKLIATLKKNKLPALDLTDNEMAKLHLRHLVGGRAPEVSDEIMYRFEFPERPGALMNFLNSMSHNWNISLFHYRNHGADYGRVLVGMQVPRHDKKALQDFLNQLGYRYWDESENPAYRLFLV
jgi:threonine dehydratase